MAADFIHWHCLREHNVDLARRWLACLRKPQKQERLDGYKGYHFRNEAKVIGHVQIGWHESTTFSTVEDSSHTKYRVVA